MKKNLFTYVFLIFVAIMSCTEVEEPLIDNEYDPLYENLSPPLAEITSTSPSNGSVIGETSATFSWKGVSSSSKFAYKLEGVDVDFSRWSIKKTITYNNLDEGSYTFLVKEQLMNEKEQTNPTSVEFEVNAITNFGLVLEKMNTEAPIGDNFSINLNVEEADDLSGLTTVVNFNFDRVRFVSASKNDIAGIDVGVFTKNIADGQVELNILLLGTQSGFSGNATLCKLNFA